jgi:hypothetical protein
MERLRGNVSGIGPAAIARGIVFDKSLRQEVSFTSS